MSKFCGGEGDLVGCDFECHLRAGELSGRPSCRIGKISKI